MLKTVRKAFQIEDIRKRLFYTFLMLIVVRFGSQLPTPGVDPTYIQNLLASQNNGAYSFFDAFTGGSFTRMSVFALSITPYITSSIIMQLLTIAIPKLEEMQKEGAEGRKKIAAITRYVTVALALIESIAMSIGFGRQGLLEEFNFVNVAIVVCTLTAGSAFLMWIGEQITSKGIGNGISLIIFAGIVSRLPDGMHVIFQYLQAGTVNILNVILFAVIALAMIVFVVAISQGIRKIPVQYAKRVVGRKMYGGHTSYIPLKVNQAGVIPIIFASSVLMFPVTIGQFVDIPWVKTVAGWFAWGTPLQTTLYVLMILFFTYFYTAVSVNIAEMSDNIKKYGGFIPGLRPGKPTTDYLDKIMSRITLAGAIFLALIALMPNVVGWITGIEGIYFGGTALLIVVGVALDTMKQVESLVLMRHYQGFMK